MSHLQTNENADAFPRLSLPTINFFRNHITRLLTPPPSDVRLSLPSSSLLCALRSPKSDPSVNRFLLIKATHIGSETALSQIVQIVEAAQLARAPFQKLADKMSRFFVPAALEPPTEEVITSAISLLYEQKQNQEEKHKPIQKNLAPCDRTSF